MGNVLKPIKNHIIYYMLLFYNVLNLQHTLYYVLSIKNVIYILLIYTYKGALLLLKFSFGQNLLLFQHHHHYYFFYINFLSYIKKRSSFYTTPFTNKNTYIYDILIITFTKVFILIPAIFIYVFQQCTINQIHDGI